MAGIRIHRQLPEAEEEKRTIRLKVMSGDFQGAWDMLCPFPACLVPLSSMVLPLDGQSDCTHEKLDVLYTQQASLCDS